MKNTQQRVELIRLLAAEAPPAPKCFESRDGWLTYLASAQVVRKGSARPMTDDGLYRTNFNYCKDCCESWAAQMTKEGRCIRPAPIQPPTKPAPMTIKNINIHLIRTDGGTQSRVSLNEAVVAEYADALNDGIDLPAVTLFSDGADFWLADGFHRLFAYRKVERASIPAEVREGTSRDAILFSVGANQAHGLRRTNDDKRKAVLVMLADAEWKTWSDRNIAKQCSVSVTLVSTVRSPAVAEKRDENRQKAEAKKKPQPEKGCSRATPTTPVGSSEESPKPASAASADPEQTDDNGPSAEEIREAEQSAADDAARVRLILESDDAMAALSAKCAQQAALIRVLESRIGGLQNEVNEHIRCIKRLKAQLVKTGVEA